MQSFRLFLPCFDPIANDTSPNSSRLLPQYMRVRKMDTAEVQSNSELDPLPDISLNGDVVLVVGPRQIQLRVHSRCLRCASKVFDAMFGSAWTEGQGLCQESPREVLLPEDDANALHTICLVLHHRNDDVREGLTAREVLQIAILADKYDLGVALKYAKEQWLKSEGIVNMLDMTYLMAAAFLFADMDAFVATTRRLIFDYEGSYRKLADDNAIREILTWETFRMYPSYPRIGIFGKKLTILVLLEERRTMLRAHVSQFLATEGSSGCPCAWSESRRTTFVNLNYCNGPLKLLDVPVSKIIKDLKEISIADSSRESCAASYCMRTFSGKVEAVKKKAVVCLDCVPNSSATSKTSCRFQHE